MSNASFGLTIRLGHISLTKSRHDLDCLAQEFSCEITAEDDRHTRVIGEVSGWIVPFYVEDRPIDVHDAADAADSLCWHLVEAVVDPKENGFREELNLQSCGGILCVSEMRLLPEFRGRGIGLATLWHILAELGRGCALAVIKPYPLDATLEPSENPYGLARLDSLSEEEIRLAQKTLANYWSRLGFVPVPGSPDYLYFDLALQLGNVPEIQDQANRNGRSHG